LIKILSCLRHAVVPSILLCGTASIAFGQTDVSGFWKYTVPERGVSFLELKQVGNEIFVDGRNGFSTKPFGELKGNKLHLEIPSPFGSPDAKRFTTYDAVLNGVKFAATRKDADGDSTEGSLEKVSREEDPAAFLCLNCANCPITGWCGHRPWDGTAGTSSTTNLTMPRCGKWLTQWYRAE
jgi:hypothetical protein